jgi:pilus assembly protein FimV
VAEDARVVARRIVEEVLAARRRADAERDGGVVEDGDPRSGASEGRSSRDGVDEHGAAGQTVVDPRSRWDAPPGPAVADELAERPSRAVARRIVAEVLAAHAAAEREVQLPAPAAEAAGPPAGAEAVPLQPVPERPAVVPGVAAAALRPEVELDAGPAAVADDAASIARRIVENVIAEAAVREQEAREAAAAAREAEAREAAAREAEAAVREQQAREAEAREAAAREDEARETVRELDAREAEARAAATRVETARAASRAPAAGTVGSVDVGPAEAGPGGSETPAPGSDALVDAEPDPELVREAEVREAQLRDAVLREAEIREARLREARLGSDEGPPPIPAAAVDRPVGGPDPVAADALDVDDEDPDVTAPIFASRASEATATLPAVDDGSVASDRTAEDEGGGVATLPPREESDAEVTTAVPMASPPGKRTHWLIVSIVGAVGLAVLLPLAIAALRSLVALS